ncbi:MAG: glycosyltransferase [Robiginitomaculum sp.]
MPNKTDLISVVMPTFRRPEGLKIALDSLLAQSDCGLPVEIIIADNDPAGSARAYVEAQAKTASLPIHYLHVAEPGVSNARNGALAKASGRYIAWLDDDQDASKGWLKYYLETARKYKAAMVFSPTYARIADADKYTGYYETFFSRKGPGIDEGIIEEFYGCGNSFMDLSLCELPSPVFDPKANETGGEDDLLFSFIVAQGVTMAWREAAICHEDIRPHRATPSYIKKRSFAFGQGPSEAAHDNGNYLGVIKWMLVGTAQMLGYFPLLLLSKITGSPRYISHLSKLWQGAGKICWFGAFKPKLYGQAVTANKAF